MSRNGKIKDLDQATLEVGKPIKAMLAGKAASIEEGFKLADEAILEIMERGGYY